MQYFLTVFRKLKLKYMFPSKKNAVPISIWLMAGIISVILLPCVLCFSDKSLPSSLFAFQFAGIIVGALTWFWSIYMSVMSPSVRKRAVYFVLVLVFPISVVFNKWSYYHHAVLRREWFLRSGIFHYQNIVDKIEARNNLQVDKPFGFWDGETYVSVRPNSNGLVMMTFKPREGNPRLGYIYYSGSILKLDPFNPVNSNFCYLTNHWYEF